MNRLPREISLPPDNCPSRELSRLLPCQVCCDSTKSFSGNCNRWVCRMVEKNFSRTTQYLAAEIGNFSCGPKNPIFCVAAFRRLPPTLIRSKNRTEGVDPERGGGTTASSSPDKETFKPSGAFRSEEIRLSRNPTWGRQTLGRNGGSRQRIGKAD